MSETAANKKMIVQSMGFGVQSVTIAAMACFGDLPMPDLAVFADPGWESQATYAYKKWFEGWAAERGLKIITASKGDIRADLLNDKGRFASMPFFSLIKGKKVLLRRQCTREYKIDVVHKEIRQALGLKPRQRSKTRVELWIGISLDEITRMKNSWFPWVDHRWPLVEKRMRRDHCEAYLISKGIPVPPKSACVGCPYHDNKAWAAMKANSPAEFADCVAFEKAVQKTRVAKNYPVFLHKSCVPLDQADFRGPQESYDLFDNECDGHCGL